MEGRTLVFVDGENLVFRYQAMKKSGLQPQPNIKHREDCFVWQPELISGILVETMRVFYYTSVSGDQNKIAEVEKEIAQTQYAYTTIRAKSAAQLIPRVFKKEEKSRKSRHVDIHISP